MADRTHSQESPPAAGIQGSQGASSVQPQTLNFAAVPPLGSTAYREGEQCTADETHSQESPPAAENQGSQGASVQPKILDFAAVPAPGSTAYREWEQRTADYGAVVPSLGSDGSAYRYRDAATAEAGTVGTAYNESSVVQPFSSGRAQGMDPFLAGLFLLSPKTNICIAEENHEFVGACPIDGQWSCNARS